MTILPAGSFRVSDYRKAIPVRVQHICLINLLMELESQGRQLGLTPTEFVDALRFDHRPPLQDRPYDTEKGDFIPPQNDPNHIEAIFAKEHDQRTFGRRADAEKIVTTRGSDVGERKHIRLVSNTQQLHEVKMAAKRGDPEAIARILGVQKERRRPKSRIPSRPFPKRQKRA